MHLIYLVRFFLILIVVLSAGNAFAQAKDARGFYLVEAEKFTPPTKEVIESLQGKKAESFLASDLKGQERTLQDYQGKPVLLVFGSTDNQVLIDALSTHYRSSKGAYSVIFMAQESRSFLQENSGATENIPFTIIPEGTIFSEMAYAGSLGLPRIFGIDDKGIITRIIPATMLTDMSMLPDLLTETIDVINP